MQWTMLSLNSWSPINISCSLMEQLLSCCFSPKSVKMARASNKSYFVVVETGVILCVQNTIFIFSFLPSDPGCCVLDTSSAIATLVWQLMPLWSPAPLPPNSIAQRRTLFKLKFRTLRWNVIPCKNSSSVTCHRALLFYCSLSWLKSGIRVCCLLPSSLCDIMSCNSDHFFQKIRNHCCIKHSNIVCLKRRLKEII